MFTAELNSVQLEEGSRQERFARQCSELALSRFLHRIRVIHVSMKDEEKPLCRVRIQLDSITIRTEGEGTRLEEAIAESFARAERRIAHFLLRRGAWKGGALHDIAADLPRLKRAA